PPVFAGAFFFRVAAALFGGLFLFLFLRVARGGFDGGDVGGIRKPLDAARDHLGQGFAGVGLSLRRLCGRGVAKGDFCVLDRGGDGGGRVDARGGVGVLLHREGRGGKEKGQRKGCREKGCTHVGPVLSVKNVHQDRARLA